MAEGSRRSAKRNKREMTDNDVAKGRQEAKKGRLSSRKNSGLNKQVQERKGASTVFRDATGPFISMKRG